MKNIARNSIAALMVVLSVACSKDEISENKTPCGCEVVVKGNGQTFNFDYSNSQIQSEYPGVVGCGDRADQAEFKHDIIEQIQIMYGNQVAAQATGFDFRFNNFYCD